MRSEVTSRSNWAKDNRTLSVSRPIEVVVLNCCVTETKDTLLASRISTILAKSASEPVDLVDDHDVDPPRLDLHEQPLQRRPIHCGAGEPAIVVPVRQAHPALLP